MYARVLPAVRRTDLDDEDAEQRERRRLDADVGRRRQRRVLDVLLEHGEERHGCDCYVDGC